MTSSSGSCRCKAALLLVLRGDSDRPARHRITPLTSKPARNLTESRRMPNVEQHGRWSADINRGQATWQSISSCAGAARGGEALLAFLPAQTFGGSGARALALGKAP